MLEMTKDLFGIATDNTDYDLIIILFIAFILMYVIKSIWNMLYAILGYKN